MPRKSKSASVNFKDGAEHLQIQALAAAAGLSVANWFRVQAGLEPLRHGGYRLDGISTIRCDLNRENKTLSFKIVQGAPMAYCYYALAKREPITSADRRQAEISTLHNLHREGADIENYSLAWEGKAAKKASKKLLEAARVDIEAQAFENLQSQFEMLPDE